MSSEIFVKIHAVLRKLHMIQHMTTNVDHVPHGPCTHPPSCQKDVKLSKRSQVVKKMSDFKKSNTWTMEEAYKKLIDIMRFTHIELNFDVTYYGDQNPSKCA